MGRPASGVSLRSLEHLLQVKLAACGADGPGPAAKTAAAGGSLCPRRSNSTASVEANVQRSHDGAAGGLLPRHRELQLAQLVLQLRYLAAALRRHTSVWVRTYKGHGEVCQVNRSIHGRRSRDNQGSRHSLRSSLHASWNRNLDSLHAKERRDTSQAFAAALDTLRSAGREAVPRVAIFLTARQCSCTAVCAH